MTFNWTIIIFIIIALVAADKLLTVANINAVKKNFPNVDPLSIEKNPLAKEFFKQYGLTGGTILYGLFSLVCFLVAMLLIHWCLKLFHVSNSLSIAFYVLVIWYGWVLMNNFYFLLKYSRIIT